MPGGPGERNGAEAVGKDATATAATPPRPFPAGRGKGRDRWHAGVAAVAITLGCVLAPVAVLGVWAANQD